MRLFLFCYGLIQHDGLLAWRTNGEACFRKCRGAIACELTFVVKPFTLLSNILTFLWEEWLRKLFIQFTMPRWRSNLIEGLGFFGVSVLGTRPKIFVGRWLIPFSKATGPRRISYLRLASHGF